MAASAIKADSGQSANSTDRQAGSMPAAVSRWGLQQADLPSYRVINRFGHPYPQTLATTEDGLAERTASARKAAEDYRPIPQAANRGLKSQATFLRLSLHHLEHCKVKYLSGGGNRYKGLQRLVAAVGTCPRVCLSPTQVYLKGQTRREGLSQGSESPKSTQKGALAPSADYELWYQDESEFHLHPHLTYAWMPRGKQKRVPSPGKNRKQTVFGAFCYGRGLFYHHTQPRKTAWGVRVLLQRLVRRAKRTGRRIVLVMDQGNPHHAKALKRHLEQISEYIEAFWLPYYCPELNLIEGLWKHLKCSRMANVLFSSFKQFAEHLSEALNDFGLHPDFTLSVAIQKPREIIRKKLLVGT
jgi:hypothetical protein